MNLTKFEKFLSEKKAEVKILQDKKSNLESTIKSCSKDLINLKEAKEISNLVGILVQDKVKTLIETLVTQALQSVFGEEYSFEIESRIVRNQPEMDLYVVENGVRYSPKDEKGDGILDIVSFALRVVIWAISEPRSHNTLIFDEPFRCMGKNTLGFIGSMLQQISSELGLQFIIITHEKELAENACITENDLILGVKKIDGISYVEVKE